MCIITPLKTKAQTVFQLNGRTITESNSQYYVTTTEGTLAIDQDYITVKFEDGDEESGKHILINEHGMQYIGKSAESYYVFKINESSDYHLLLDSLNQVPEIENTILSYIGQYCDDKPFPNDQETNPFNAWYVGETMPADPELEFLNLRGAWPYTTGNSDIIVAVIDEGNDWSQTDMPSDNGLGYNFSNYSTNTYPNHSNGPRDHGTKMTSVICSKTNNNVDIFGVAGGWNGTGGVTPMMVVNANPTGTGWSTALTPLCINWAAMHGARVINMSFGIIGLNEEEQAPIKAAIDDALASKKVIFVAAAGNYGSSTGNLYTGVFFPASYEPVIAVGGALQDHSRCSGSIFGSCYGTGLDFVTSIDSYYNRGTIPGSTIRLGYGSGTSFSSALMSGVISLMLSANPCLSYTEVYNILKDCSYKTTGYTFTNGWNENVGYGFPNAKTAVELSLGLSEPGPTITQNTTWNTPKYFNSDVVVASGATLTINTTVKFEESVKLIIQQGGRVDVSGGKLTSLCDEFWDGVVVYGNPQLPQTPASNQGKLTFNESVIENATSGIRICIPLPADNPSAFCNNGGGGILEANGSDISNCMTGISFAPYTNANISRLINCTIGINEQFKDETPFYSGMNLNGINGLVLKGIRFLNRNTELWYSGYGIHSFNSAFKTDFYCDNNDSPCTGYEIDCSFERMEYGIYAENASVDKLVSINNTDFLYNLKGFYGSALYMPEFLSNSFISYDQRDESYSLYLNNCNQYHVEANVFNGDAYHLNSDIGIYILNSGLENNEVYNNTFSNLQYGAVADGINRSWRDGTGLCFKCNDFSNCVNDITVSDADPIYSMNFGIRTYQGTPGTLNTDAAGNTFSTNGTMNFGNYLYPVIYVHHEFKNPGTVKIIPDPRTASTVSLQPNMGTTYQKSISCPSHLQNEETEELTQEMDAAVSGVQVAETQLAAFTDGGDTEALNDEVQTAQSGNTYTLYEELMATSPYLSDVVMKSGIENTAALPDAMLRDVLVANPHSAKSGDVMNALDKREIPLPGEMMEEVQAGLNIFGSYDNMRGNLAMWKDRFGHATAGLARIYAGDSLPARAADSLAHLYTIMGTKEAKYSLAILETARGNQQAALAALASICSNFVLTGEEQALHNDYAELVSQVNALQQLNPSVLAADSVSLSGLLPLTQNDRLLPGAVARNILHAAGLLSYTEPVNLNTNTKSSRVIDSNAEGQGSTVKPGSASLEVFPNPAKEYCIARYNLNSDKGSISITSVSGTKLYELKLNNKCNSTVIPLTTLPRGTVILQLVEDGKTISASTLILY